MSKQISKATIKRLITLNNDFYNKVAEPFTKTRSYSWTGWEMIADFFTKQGFVPQRILDLGCGNGRFLNFVKQYWPFLEYLGVDANAKLLEYAQINFSGLESAKFLKYDFLANPEFRILTGKYDLVVLLGVMHHVPGEALRRQILAMAADKLHTEGYLIVTFWDFLSEQKLAKKIVPWANLDIAEADIGERDYLLDWKRDEYAYRYCHYYNTDEIAELAKAANLEIVTEFLADGPGGRANRYVVFRKS